MKYSLIILIHVCCLSAFCQNSPPWERPLKISYSSDGINFSNTTVFQDSSGVPSAVRWKGDTLVCAFQWFRQPMNSPTWDRVAVKFSYDAGQSWTTPIPITINNFPPNFQRPFDPALAVINSDSLRIYYSSSNGMPLPGADSIINTYSACSIDGINFTFEPGARFDNPSGRVIDPSVIYFASNWHYCAPVGAPQDGAYHAISFDGINFTAYNNYNSDFQHNWTGNFMAEDSSTLRFYGSGPQLWYNTTNDGYNWNGYLNTNLVGGDPTVVKTDSSEYLIIFVGAPYTTGLIPVNAEQLPIIYPNPSDNFIRLNYLTGKNAFYTILNADGVSVNSGNVPENATINLDEINSGFYILRLNIDGIIRSEKFIK